MTDQTKERLTSWVAKLLVSDSIFKSSILFFNVILAIFLQDTEVSQHALLISISLVLYTLCDFGGTTKILERLNELSKIEILQQVIIVRLINITIFFIPTIILLKLMSSFAYFTISNLDILFIILYAFSLLLNFDALLIYYRQHEVIAAAGLIGGLTVVVGLLVTIQLGNHVSSFTTLIISTFLYSLVILYKTVTYSELHEKLQWNLYSLFFKQNFKHAEMAFVNSIFHQSPIIIMNAFGYPNLVSQYFLFQRFNQVLTMPTAYFVQGMALNMKTKKRDIERILLKFSFTFFVIISVLILSLWMLQRYIQNDLRDHVTFMLTYLFFALSIPMIIQQQYLIQSFVLSGRIRTYSLLTSFVLIISIGLYNSKQFNLNMNSVIMITLVVGFCYTALLWFLRVKKL